ncbi:pseudaminic acid biosynthesis-associated methylase [Calditrichota bacterium GD2]
MPDASFSAVEINKLAYDELKKLEWLKTYNESILTFNSNEEYDLIFTKGVLIHINPDYLEEVYNKLYKYSKKYILVAEYYNPVPIEVKYRGYSGKLFKRDFAGELLNKYPDLKLVDYGFSYHLDPNFPQDDLNWFLISKGF